MNRNGIFIGRIALVFGDARSNRMAKPSIQDLCGVLSQSIGHASCPFLLPSHATSTRSHPPLPYLSQVSGSRFSPFIPVYALDAVGAKTPSPHATLPVRLPSDALLTTGGHAEDAVGPLRVRRVDASTRALACARIGYSAHTSGRARMSRRALERERSVGPDVALCPRQGVAAHSRGGVARARRRV
jgi:hypothetical protein